MGLLRGSRWCPWMFAHPLRCSHVSPPAFSVQPGTPNTMTGQGQEQNSLKTVPFVLTPEYSLIAIHLNFLITANNIQFLPKIQQPNFSQTSIYALFFHKLASYIYLYGVNILVYKYLSRKQSCTSKASLFEFHLL